VLFEIAPLDGYRIVLRVDERDISDVQLGQKGRLALQALPGDSLPLTVDRITPVASSEGDRNVFRVEARLDTPSSALRPGMEGVAKIEIERRRLLWIWTHRIIDTVRLWAWSWWP
jgi:aminoglycoside phosphotransferase